MNNKLNLMFVALIAMFLVGCGGGSGGSGLSNPTGASTFYVVRGTLNTTPQNSPMMMMSPSADTFLVKAFGESSSDFAELEYNDETSEYSGILNFKPVHIVVYKNDSFLGGINIDAEVIDDEITFGFEVDDAGNLTSATYNVGEETTTTDIKDQDYYMEYDYRLFLREEPVYDENGNTRVACIKDGVIVNIVIAESTEQLYELFPTMYDIYIYDLGYMMGWRYENGEVVIPE